MTTLPVCIAASHSLLVWVIAGALLVVAGVVVFLARRRWAWAARLTNHPFAAYVSLSLAVHLMLALWAYTARLFESPPAVGIVTVELDGASSAPDPVSEQPWDALPDSTPELDPPDLPVQPAPEPSVSKPDPPRNVEPFPEVRPTIEEPTLPVAEAPPQVAKVDPSQHEMPASERPESDPADRVRPEEVPPTDVVTQQPQHFPRDDEQPSTPILDPETARRETTTTMVPHLTQSVPPTPLTPQKSEPRTAKAAVRPLRPVTSEWGAGARLPVQTSKSPRRSDGSRVPAVYRDRLAADRLALITERGGSAQTEAAVERALQWLADVQSRDGSWDASQFGGGQARHVHGRDRDSAGIDADAGVTGLALLAFLGSGHTHIEGDYADTVRAGLQFLLRTQRQHSDGRIVGSARPFAAMYCHGMATLALSESYALTADPALKSPLSRAVTFTLAAQHPVTGGWRYRVAERGDTSQLGWQLMGLTSAHYAGLSIPRNTWNLAGGFLRSVSWGEHGGLASYRPGERPTAAMTAEALMCRLFLGQSHDHPLVREAASYLLKHAPRAGTPNYYYWYYGTLALYPLQDERFAVWNGTTTENLLRRQETAGANSGSWSPESVWGGSGGRVYTTALATLTLEVYYRYRPPQTPARSPREQTAWQRRGLR